MRNPTVTCLTALAVTLALTACRPTPNDTLAPTGAHNRKLRVTTTINILTDLAQQIGGQHVDVTGLMGPGVDPHLYKASAGDVRKLANADITFYVGLHLEGKMVDILEKLERFHPSHAVTTAIPDQDFLRPDPNSDSPDPHVWFDVRLWKTSVTVVRDALTKADPQHAADYANNARAYLKELDELDAWVSAQIRSVPPEQRVLITAHDAFGYFGERYGIRVRGLQGISTTAEAGTRDVRQLADFIAERRIRAIFVESSIPRRTVEAVQAAVRARGWNVRIGGELFADSAGEAGTPEGTYIGMMRHNVHTIVTALRGQEGE